MTASGTRAPVLFGEVLFDRFPDGSVVPGGAPFNVAWNLQALGLPPVLVTRIGEDALGRRILRAMDLWGMDTSGVQRDPDHRTGTVEVTIRDGEPEFEIAAGRAYDFIDAARLPELPSQGILYHGSLALRSAPPREALNAIRQTNSAGILLDVNLRPPWWERDAVDRALQAARWAKLNRAELMELEPGGAERLVARNGLDCLVVTRGDEGATAFHRDGRVEAGARPEPAEVVDTVGAGDAFTSVMILGLTRGWKWPDILKRAQSFASAVVGLRGATSDDPGFYDRFQHDWDPR